MRHTHTAVRRDGGFHLARCLQTAAKRNSRRKCEAGGDMRKTSMATAAGLAAIFLSSAAMAGKDVDVCRAVSAAIFGDSEKVKYVPLSSQQRFTALQSGEVDMLSNNTTVTLTRDTALGFDFGAVTYYDGQGFLVNKKLGVKSAKELSGA